MNNFIKLRGFMFGRSNYAFLFKVLFCVIVSNSLAAQTVTGIYSNTHIVSVLDYDGWIETEVTDSLILTELENDSLHFEFYLFHTNGHTCSMNGVAAKVDSLYEYIVMFEKEYEADECKLHIIISESEIILKDVDNGCRLWYCGMRGYINGVTFSRN